MNGLSVSPHTGRDEDIVPVRNAQLPTPALSPLGSPFLDPQHRHGIPSSKIIHNVFELELDSSDEHAAGPPETEASLPPQLDGISESKASNGRSHSNIPPTERPGEPNSPSHNPASPDSNRTLKLSPTQITDLTNDPEALPVRQQGPFSEKDASISKQTIDVFEQQEGVLESKDIKGNIAKEPAQVDATPGSSGIRGQSWIGSAADRREVLRELAMKSASSGPRTARPSMSARTVSTPPAIRRKHSDKKVNGVLQESTRQGRAVPPPLNLKENSSPTARSKTVGAEGDETAYLRSLPTPVGDREFLRSPLPATLPLPPPSLPTYLQLELATDRVSPLYIHRSTSADSPYESIAIKLERLINFGSLPLQLEHVLWFGSLACLDAWLHIFTILPLRFLNALSMVFWWWARNGIKEALDLCSFIYSGIGRLWARRKGGVPRSEPASRMNSRRPSLAVETVHQAAPTRNRDNVALGKDFVDQVRLASKRKSRHHRRSRSTPSTLQSSHKADLCKGLLLVASCAVLMRLDASRMYHNIRGQAAIKLYVIYNVLEVGDRLLSAFGQDVLEVLLSPETLSRSPITGRSRILRPAVLFLVALIYNVMHSVALFYQVITLNVAVNSYSNALLTLLMSNQFVEIKGTVFKKFEKENLFQLTCADIVERFQLWLMLLIIAMRNIVEVGGLSISLASSFTEPATASATGAFSPNATSMPRFTASILPKSFTILPKLFGDVFAPFLIVLGSEMLVDWLKHAYISKFNATTPRLYGRFLDVLAKDYYIHAFSAQDLTKRLGLPVLPLACLFIRASTQTYHMFLATHVPLPLPSAATSVSLDNDSTSSPATTAILAHIDTVFRRALGRSSFGGGSDPGGSALSIFETQWWTTWTIDDLIAVFTMLLVAIFTWFILLLIKLLLGMALLNFSRHRYRTMQARDGARVDTEGRRVGMWGMTEVREGSREWIYRDHPEELARLREKDRKVREGKGKEDDVVGKLENVERYEMAAKRIW